MRFSCLTLVILLLAASPSFAAKSTRATAYYRGKFMTNGERPSSGRSKAVAGGKRGVIALSRPLARDLGLKCGPGQFDYRFGVTVVLKGTGGYDGEYVFKDLMPRQWKHYRVDIYFPTLRECRVFGLRECQIWLKGRK